MSMEYHVLRNKCLKIWPGRRARYENINNSDLDGMSLPVCQSRADVL